MNDAKKLHALIKKACRGVLNIDACAVAKYKIICHGLSIF